MKRLLLLFATLCCMAMMHAEIVHHEKCDPTYTTVGYAQECWEDTETGKLYAEEDCTNELNPAVAVLYPVFAESPIYSYTSYGFSVNEHQDFDGTRFNYVGIGLLPHAEDPEHRSVLIEFAVYGGVIDNARLKFYLKEPFPSGKVTISNNGNQIANLMDYGDVGLVAVPLQLSKGGNIIKVELRPDVLTAELVSCFCAVSLEYTLSNESVPNAVFPCIASDSKRKFKGTNDPELTYGIYPSSLTEKYTDIIVSRDLGEAPGFYTIHVSQAGGANPDDNIPFHNGTLEIVDGVRHEKGEILADGTMYVLDCWEEKATGKYYADDYLEQELKFESIIGCPKLPSNPVTATDGFSVKESATYEGVPYDWVAETTYGQGESGKRTVEFTVTEPSKYNNARLAWYFSGTSGPGFGYRNHKIYKNDVVVDSKNQAANENLSGGVFYVPLSDLKKGDKIKFDLEWSGGWNTPTVAACLQYITPQDLCLMAQDAGSTVELKRNGATEPVKIQYSTDYSSWTTVDFSSATTTGTITLANVGDRVYFRKADEGVASGFSKSFTDYYQFVMTGSIAASGNVMSLIDNTCKSTSFPANGAYCFACLFSGCKSLASTPELPAMTLADGCYYWMFNGCTGLSSAPELPAMTLAYGCYQAMYDNCTGLKQVPALPATTMKTYCYAGMFRGCTSLTEAPELSATTLEFGCYSEMFSGCTSLETAPELPVTTLQQNCYDRMFYGCTSLTTAPELPATTLPYRCYDQMFSGCTNLNLVKVPFTEWTNNTTNNWLNGVASTGTFVCPDALDKSQTGANYIPTSWTPAFEVKANNEPETENYYATFYSKENTYEVPEGVTAYTGVVEESASNPDESVLKLTTIEGGIIPAEEPVILKATKSQVYLPYTTETAINNPDNKLEGTDVATTLGANQYALSLGQKGVGFYLWNGKAIGANKAYLTLTASAGAKAFTFQFDDGETTGILKPVMDEKKDSPAYNLNGMRVNDNYKGIVIKNGKKIYQK